MIRFDERSRDWLYCQVEVEAISFAGEEAYQCKARREGSRGWYSAETARCRTALGSSGAVQRCSPQNQGSRYSPARLWPRVNIWALYERAKVLPQHAKQDAFTLDWRHLISQDFTALFNFQSMHKMASEQKCSELYLHGCESSCQSSSPNGMSECWLPSYSAVWHEKLKQYQLTRPSLRIVDSFEAVMQLTNRISMLDPVRDGFVLKVVRLHNNKHSAGVSKLHYPCKGSLS